MRRLLTACLPVIACVGFAPAQAAPVSTTFHVTGNVATKCTLQNVTMSPSVTVGSNGMIGSITVNSPSTWSLSASCSGPSTLAVTAKSLRITSPAPKTSMNTNEAQTINYTATASGWSTANATVTTSDTALGSATYSITGTAQSRTTPGVANISVSYGSFAIPNNGSNTKLDPGSYSATITLSLAPAS